MKKMDESQLASHARDVVASHLRCVICSTLTLRSVQCFNGHTHCIDCQRRMKYYRLQRTVSCSICRNRHTWNSTRAIADVASQLQLKVRCDDCADDFDIDAIDSHRAECDKKRFACPIDCNLSNIQMADLVEHMKRMHRRVTRVLGHQQSLNCIMQAVEDMRVYYLIFKDRLVSLRISMNPCRVDGFNLEVLCGMFGNLGSVSTLRIRITLCDLSSSDTVQHTTKIQVVDDDAHLAILPSLPCFNNFIAESLREPVNVVSTAWRLPDFQAACSSLVDEDYDSHRVAAFVIEVLEC